MVNNEFLFDAIQSLGEGFSLYDAAKSFQFCNQTFTDLFEFEINELCFNDQSSSNKTNDFVSDDLLIEKGDKADEWSKRFINHVSDHHRDYSIERSDGRLFIGSIKITELGNYLIIVRDVTEQRRAEQAERESDMLLHKIVEACPATFLVSRVSDGKIIYCPPGSRERFGKIESTLSFFLSPDDRATYLDALLPTGVLDNYRVRFRRGDGSIMDGLTSARVTDYRDEDVIVSSTRDITELLAMQEELEQQREIAHQNEKVSALGGLLAGVAHELNNPLSIVLGYAYMLQNQVEGESAKRRVDRLAQAAERCSKIVKTFLAMARQKPTLIESCSINDVIELALDITEYSLTSKGIDVQQQLNSDVPPVAIDQDQIAQVFTNLIINAESAMSSKDGEATLSIRSYVDEASGQVVVEIADNGIGIDEDMQDRIFEPFFTTKDVGEGTGVGLAFCLRIVSSHQGELTVNSSKGNGACFSVRLPVADGLYNNQDQSLPATSSEMQKKRILVVDDEVHVANMITELLQDKGYQTVSLNDAESALKLLDKESFDAVLSDVKMPGMDGSDFYDQLADRNSAYLNYVGFVTGDTLSQRVADLLDRSGCQYIEKPISPDALFQLVERLCQQQG